jgi:hypothetical protein
VEQAAAGAPNLRCPINQDAELVFDWEQGNGEPATSASIEDVVCFVEQGEARQGPPFRWDATGSGAPAAARSGTSSCCADSAERLPVPGARPALGCSDEPS